MLSDETAKKLRELSVLYADDDSALLSYMKIILDGFFNTVYLAGDGVEALGIYDTKKPDIIILDNKMPKLNGLDVAKIIREHDNQTPIFFTTNYADKNDLLLAVKLNLVEYMLKPISIEKLESAFEVCLGKIDKAKTKLHHLKNGSYYDFGKKEIVRDGVSSVLAKKEAQFLELLIQKRGSVATLRELEEQIWDGCMSMDTLRNLVSRLRSKGADGSISNVHNIGYKIG